MVAGQTSSLLSLLSLTSLFVVGDEHRPIHLRVSTTKQIERYTQAGLSKQTNISSPQLINLLPDHFTFIPTKRCLEHAALCLQTLYATRASSSNRRQRAFKFWIWKRRTCVLRTKAGFLATRASSSNRRQRAFKFWIYKRRTCVLRTKAGCLGRCAEDRYWRHHHRRHSPLQNADVRCDNEQV